MALNEAIAVWQLLTGDIVKSQTVAYIPPPASNLIDQTTIEVPYAGTLRITCEPIVIALTIEPVNDSVETTCAAPTTLTDTVYADILSITGGSGTLVTWEWRDYESTSPTSNYVVVYSGSTPGTMTLANGQHYIRLYVEDDAGNTGLSTNYLSFCMDLP
jgi:hypothetical protein